MREPVREGERESVENGRVSKREQETESLRFPGLVVGWLERGATTPLSAVMRSVVDGPLIFLLAPPFPPVSGAQSAGPGERSLSPRRVLAG